MSSLKKNLINNLLLTASGILFPLITFPYIVRTLSGADYGKVTFLDAFTQYFLLLSALGVPVYGIREISKLKDQPQACSKLVIELVLIQLMLGFILCCLFFALPYFLEERYNDPSLIFFGCLVIIGSSFLIEWFYQGIENFTYITRRSLILKTLSVVLILVFVKSTNDYLVYYAIISLTIVLGAIINFIYFLRRFYVRHAGSLAIKIHIKPLLILFSINLAISVYTILDTIILGFLTDPLNVSLYFVPLRITKLYWSVVAGIGIVLVPRITTLYANENKQAISDLLKKSMSLVFLLTLPFCLFCFLFPKHILTLVAEDKYLEAIPALRLLGFVPLIIGLCNVFGTQFLLPAGKEKFILQGTIAGLIISLAFNFLLIPHFKFMGAAIACMLSELAVCLYVFAAARTRIRLKIDIPLLWQIGISSLAVIAGKFALGRHFENEYLILNCAIIYGLTFLALQFFYFKNPLITSILKIKRDL